MRRIAVSMLVCLITLVGLISEARSQEKYPNRPIELVVPFGPGGTADVAARAYSDTLAKLLNVPITVVNRAGGAGIQGTDFVIRSKKDGYTLLAATDTPLIVSPVISKEVSYDSMKDVIPLGLLGYAPSIFAVRADSPFKTLRDVVEYARQNPGKLKNATSGYGSEAFFNLQILCHKEKLKIVSIPFKSGAEAVTALLGEHTDLSSNSTASLGPQIKAGALRGLAISSKERNPDFPDIPTTAELGCPEVSLSVWVALFAPAGVPKEVIDVLVPAVEKAFKNPEVIERASNAGIIVQYVGPQEVRKLMESGLALIKEAAPEADLVKSPEGKN